MSEKTTRSVRCERHGLRYDPNLTSGCPRCRGESFGTVAPGSKRSAPPLVVWLVAAAAVVLVMAQFFGDRGDAGPGESDRSGVSVSTSNEGSARDSTPTRDSSESGDRMTEDGFRLFEGRGRVTIDDPPEKEPFKVGDKWAPEIRSVTFETAGEILTAEIELVDSLVNAAHDFALGIQVAALFLDTDNDASTGAKGFAGRVGFEIEVDVYLGVRYSEDDSYTYAGGRENTVIHDFRCSHSIASMVSNKGPSFYFAWDEEAESNTECRSASIVVRIPYRRLGVEPGDEVRIATEESMGSGKVRDYFLDDAVMTF